MLTAFVDGGHDCQVLGASLKNVLQIQRLAEVGCQAVTITPDMFDTLIAHTSTDSAMESFKQAWEAKFQDKQLSDFIPR